MRFDTCSVNESPRVICSDQNPISHTFKLSKIIRSAWRPLQEKWPIDHVNETIGSMTGNLATRNCKVIANWIEWNNSYKLFDRLKTCFSTLQMTLQVSWVRHRDVHLLTIGRYTYTNDQRFRPIHNAQTDDWTLEIKYPQLRDSGYYECQVSTTPHMSHIVYLDVIGESFSFTHFSHVACVRMHVPSQFTRNSNTRSL